MDERAFLKSVGLKLGLISLLVGAKYVWQINGHATALDVGAPGAIGEKAFLAFVWLVAGIAFIQVFNRLVWDYLGARSLGKKPPRLLVQLTSFVMLVLVISGIIYWIFDYPVTALWAASGALGIVVGLALRNLILDTFSGLAIHMEQPFKHGDWINCHTRFGSFVGRVDDINWRTTRLWGAENNVIIVPNSQITSTILTNYSRPSATSEFELNVVLDFSVPPDRALRVIDAAIQETVLNGIFVADPAPKVRISKMVENGVVYTAVYFLDLTKVSIGKAKHAYYANLLKHLAAAGLSVSYPKRDVFRAEMPWRQKTWTHQGDAVRLLGRIPLFERLGDDDVQVLTRGMSLTPFTKGETIVTLGEKGESMFIVAEGILEVMVHDHEGCEIKVAELTPGSFFGEKSLLTGEPRSATVRALTTGLAAEITKPVMQGLMEQNDSVVTTLSRVLAEREVQNRKTIDGAKESSAEVIDTATKGFVTRIRRFFSG